MSNQQAARELPEWMTCESRAPWVRNGLVYRRDQMRKLAIKMRNAYQKEFMGVPSKYFADACDEAARAFDSRIAEIDAARNAKKGAP